MTEEFAQDREDKLVDFVYNELQCENAVTKEIIRLSLGDVKLFDIKQSDRGPENIRVFGSKGCVLRMQDKMSRIITIDWHGKEPRVSEPVENEYADMAVYALIARVVKKGLWK
jgi:hypothetical protein